jgi:D-alanyl-D-alanine carboxypeptidase (penicillin-binding protein 5/6)
MSKTAIAVWVAATLVWTAGGALVLWPDRDQSDGGNDRERPQPAAAGAGPAVPPSAQRLPPVQKAPNGGATPPGAARFAVGGPPSVALVRPGFRHPPQAGLLFDVDSGDVLWSREAERRLPIASLTKLMTALVIAERHRSQERVLISTKSPRVEGSKIGLLRPGRRVPLRALFLGLLLVSGNDAAAALAEHDAGTIGAFVAKMNRRARQLGLACTRFAGPSGLQDNGNRSCAEDLATLARAALAQPEIAAVTARRRASPRFPTRGGRLHLTNNHYFVQGGIRGLRRAHVTGLKTGYTNGAGRCYVTTARLGDRHLGVVLLNSTDPLRQIPKLLRQGFHAVASSQ